MVVIITSEQLLELLTTEDVIDILCNLGSNQPKQGDTCLIFQTICHGGNRHKLVYYIDNKFFQCLTNCGTMSIYDLIMNISNCEFIEALNYIAKYKGINVHQKHKGLGSGKSNEDLEFLNQHLYKTKRQLIQLPAYDKNVLNVFDDYIPSSWANENINEDIMKYFGVKFYFNQYKGIIPHYDINGNLVGIQSRNFLQSEIDKGKKYIPISIQHLTYRFPMHFNLYGVYQNKDNIKRLKKAIIFESPKSVWLYGSYYGQENNIALASCGLTLSSYQRDILLDLGVDEVTMAWDKQYKVDIIDEDKTSPEYKEYVNFIKSIQKATGLFLKYCEISVIFDWQPDGERICYKDAPIDNGKQIFEELYRERYLIDDEEQLKELIE